MVNSESMNHRRRVEKSKKNSFKFIPSEPLLVTTDVNRVGSEPVMVMVRRNGGKQSRQLKVG
jgi:hypothetical protein